MNCKTLLLLLLSSYLFSCSDTQPILHKGEKLVTATTAIVDTITISCPEGSSGYGNYYLNDTTITLADAMACTFYDFSLDGKFLGDYFRKGRGKNEITAMMFAYPIEGDLNNRCLIVDNSYGSNIFKTTEKELGRNVALKFHWDGKQESDYTSPKMYGIIGLADLGLSFHLTPDSMMIFQAGIINRNTASPDAIESNRYSNGAIFGKLNLQTMEVDSMFGHFPDIYKQHTIPHIEYFDYAMASDTLYVSHAIDSLIYAYRYPDKLLYTFGYECKGINRNYTETTRIDLGEIFEKDIQNVGLNTELIYCKENQTLARTYIKSMVTGETGLQIYKDNNLIADVDVPAFFKLLGYKNGSYYGVSYKPDEQEDKTNLLFYKLKIS